MMINTGEHDSSMVLNDGLLNDLKPSPVRTGPLWSPATFAEDTSPDTSPTFWKYNAPQPGHQRDKADLFKMYETLPGNMFDLSLKDMVEHANHNSKSTTRLDKVQEIRSYETDEARMQSGKSMPPTQSSPHRQWNSPPRTPSRNTNQRSPKVSPRLSPLQSPSLLRSPLWDPTETSPSLEPHLSKSSPAPPTLPVTDSSVAPVYNCSNCSKYIILMKTRCLVCGKLYCNDCLSEAMGSMPEGRKCLSTCLGRPFGKLYVKKAGRSCWPFGISAEAKVAELKWARRRTVHRTAQQTHEETTRRIGDGNHLTPAFSPLTT